MSTDDTKTADQAPDDRIESLGRAAVVVKIDDAESRYSMFNVGRITGEGAFLAGSLLLELGEVVTLELSLAGGVEIRTDARVVGLDAGRAPGINVEFSGLDASQSELLKDRGASGARA